VETQSQKAAMAKSNSFLAVDFGAGTLKVAEFETNEAGGLVLKQYVLKPLGLEGSQETKREALVLKKLQEAIAELGIKAKEINVSAPGFHVFSKFVKLPPVDAGKVTQIIQYEAQQNVPFPLAEVVWDYQILGTTAGGELEVLLVAIKSDIVEGLFRTTAAAGLKLQICDVSQAALCNTFRFNYGELEDCTMLLDIGAKTSNLLFFEKGKVFARSINLGANSITQDFANEAKLKFDQADKIKIDEGFVSLGGAYEEPENQHQAAISKIARQFMTRLHIQVNQTLQFYRGQQGGSAPQRLFLAGGASIMPYTAQFFAEKLNVPVEYFNPFRSVQIDPGVNLEELSPVAHSLGEVVGLGLRNMANCPVELNLMPESTLRWQSFNEKKPYLIATLASLALMALAVGFLFNKLASVKDEKLNELKPKLEELQAKDQRFKQEYGRLTKVLDDANKYADWLTDKAQWSGILREVREALIRTERVTEMEFGADTGVWVEKINAFSSLGGDPNAAGGMMPGAMPGVVPAMEVDDAMMRRYREVGRPVVREEAVYTPPTPGGVATTGGTNSGTIKLECRAVNLREINAAANQRIVFELHKQLANTNSALINAEATQLDPQIVEDEASGTFTFGITLALKRPLQQ
jgi:type IV pilus assembly protein PilM